MFYFQKLQPSGFFTIKLSCRNHFLFSHQQISQTMYLIILDPELLICNPPNFWTSLITCCPDMNLSSQPQPNSPPCIPSLSEQQAVCPHLAQGRNSGVFTQDSTSSLTTLYQSIFTILTINSLLSIPRICFPHPSSYSYHHHFSPRLH